MTNEIPLDKVVPFNESVAKVVTDCCCLSITALKVMGYKFLGHLRVESSN